MDTWYDLQVCVLDALCQNTANNNIKKCHDERKIILIFQSCKFNDP